jgi:hypothetical protein
MAQDNFQSEFQREVVDRLARLETMLSIVTRECPLCQARIGALEVDAAKTAANSSSAHHRIDGLISTALWAAGAVGGITAVLIQLVLYFLKLKGASAGGNVATVVFLLAR